jgi:hypothetical protein
MSKQSEQFQRALVRQMFVRNYEYGHEFEVEQLLNPFGVPKRKRERSASAPSGKYTFIKNRLRVPPGDIRWEMLEVLKKHTTFEDAYAEFDTKYGKGTKFKGSGTTMFSFVETCKFSLKSGWLEQEYEDGT